MRAGPDRLDHQMEVEAGDFDIEERRHRVGRGDLEAEPSVADVDDRGRPARRRHPETAEDALAPAPLTPHAREAAPNGGEGSADLIGFLRNPAL